jgi:hypothetical protein
MLFPLPSPANYAAKVEISCLTGDYEEWLDCWKMASSVGKKPLVLELSVTAERW